MVCKIGGGVVSLGDRDVAPVGGDDGAGDRSDDGRVLRARRTRARILEHAQARFLADGYGQTTITAIAAAASVAPATVYLHFTSKAGVAKALLDVLVAGDDEPIPTLERAWVREVREASDPHVHLWRHVEGATRVHRRVTPFLRVLQGAAMADDDIAQLWATNQRHRRSVIDHLVRDLGTKVALEVPVEDAIAVTELLLGPDSYGHLVLDAGWTTAHWSRWVWHQLVTAVLTPPPRAPTERS